MKMLRQIASIISKLKDDNTTTSSKSILEVEGSATLVGGDKTLQRC